MTALRSTRVSSHSFAFANRSVAAFCMATPRLHLEPASRICFRELSDRLHDLEASCSAQRVEITRLHGRIHRLEDELGHGRGWLTHLADRTTSLEQRIQQLSTKISALACIIQETLSEAVSRLKICSNGCFSGATKALLLH